MNYKVMLFKIKIMLSVNTPSVVCPHVRIIFGVAVMTRYIYVAVDHLDLKIKNLFVKHQNYDITSTHMICTVLRYSHLFTYLRSGKRVALPKSWSTHVQ